MTFAVFSVVLVALAGFASAQSSSATVPTSTAGIDACILSCVSSAASSAGCSSDTDLSCICSSTAFQTSARDCLTANCTTADLASALALQSAECAAASASSAVASATGSSASSALASASSVLSSVSSAVSSVSASSAASGSGSASASASSGSTSSSAGSKVVFTVGGAMSVIVALAGVAAGAGLIL